MRDAQIPPADALSVALEMDTVLCLGLASARRAETSVDAGTLSRIETLIAERQAAKQAKKWAEADSIRNTLKTMGIGLEDGAGGTTWKKL